MVHLQKFSKTRTQLSPGENKLFNPFVRTADYWASYDSFSSLFYVTQWVGRTNLTLLDENGPVFRLARKDAGVVISF
jgi:hypothetical protein